MTCPAAERSHNDQASASPSGPPKTNHLKLNRDLSLAHLNARACWVHHQLGDHPLFDMNRDPLPMTFPRALSATLLMVFHSSRLGDSS
jgi:hypothetical protein